MLCWGRSNTTTCTKWVFFHFSKIISFVCSWCYALAPKAKLCKFFNKMVSRQILYVEKNVHVLIDETNSLVENDAQDKEIEPDLGRKDLVLMHEGKCSEERSGPELVSKEEWQGDKQTGGTAAEPCLEQNKDNIPRNRSQNLAEQDQKHVPESCKTGAEIAPE